MRGPGLVGGRFETRALEARGGMGEIWRALDRATGAMVAVKRLHATSAAAAARFEREAQLLSAIDHPAVVRHIGHGIDDDEPWIAMEWLDGRSLDGYLLGKQLSVLEVCRLGIRIAEGLACLHARGVIHRDVKPSNVFLVGGVPEHAKLLDLGVARSTLEPSELTAARAVVGSVGYIAPEQAQAIDDLDPRADLFSLGCVLYECLSGMPAFTGKESLAILLKIIWDEVPPPSSLRAEVPGALDELVAAMMAKNRADRPRSAREVIAALEAIDTSPVRIDVPPLTSERRVATVVLARERNGSATGTITSTDVDGAPRTLTELAARHGATVVPLGGAFILAHVDGDEVATDRAYRSACLALALRDRFATPVAVATGSGLPTGRTVLGPVVDRAVELLSNAGRVAVVVDDTTAGLLGERVEIGRAGDLAEVIGPRAPGATRRLLGRPTPTVGRERELTMLAGMWSTCVDEQTTGVAVVVAEPGMGKSRIRHELESRLRAQWPHALVLLASADPFAAGSALRLAREIVRAGMALHLVPEGRVPDAIRARAAATCGDDASRVAEMLGELLGIATASPSARLQAARQDPTLMSDELRRAFVRWLRGEAERRPVLLALEDLHWGDMGSIECVDEVVRPRDRPVMVLALARPEVRDRFPALWRRSAPISVELGPLSDNAAARLVRAVLADPADAVVARLVERADGNAFYLEELIRFAAEGHVDRPPETVRAMVHARLERLARDERRVVRAASVFGERMADAGIAFVLGATGVRRTLDALVEHEILERTSTHRPGLVEYRFRHALIQDAAYATLVEGDRRAAHRAAAMWMISAGDSDALAIAEHLELAGAPSDAIPWLLAAARDASASHDAQQMIALANRALAHGPDGPLRGQLLALLAEAHLTRWNLVEAANHASEALAYLPPDAAESVSVETMGFAAAMFANLPIDAFQGALPRLLATVPTLIPSERSGFLRFVVEGVMWFQGQIDVGMEQCRRQWERPPQSIAESPEFAYWFAVADWLSVLVVGHELGKIRSIAAFMMERRDAQPSPLAYAMARCAQVGTAVEVGAVDEFDKAGRAARAEYGPTLGGLWRMWVAYWLERAGRFLGRPLEQELLEDIEAAPPPGNLNSRLVRADRLLDAGDVAGAMELVAGVEDATIGFFSPHAHLILSRAALSEGRHADALCHADVGLGQRLALPLVWAELQLVRIDALAGVDVARRALAIAETRRELERMLASTTPQDRAQVLAFGPYRRLAELVGWQKPERA